MRRELAPPIACALGGLLLLLAAVFVDRPLPLGVLAAVMLSLARHHWPRAGDSFGPLQLTVAGRQPAERGSGAATRRP